MKLQLKSRHFDTIEAIPTESQAVLDTFTETNIQEIFEWKRAGIGVYGWMGSTSKETAARIYEGTCSGTYGTNPWNLV